MFELLRSIKEKVSGFLVFLRVGLRTYMVLCNKHKFPPMLVNEQL
jgi:hypothetical protein